MSNQWPDQLKDERGDLWTKAMCGCAGVYFAMDTGFSPHSCRKCWHTVMAAGNPVGQCRDCHATVAGGLLQCCLPPGNQRTALESVLVKGAFVLQCDPLQLGVNLLAVATPSRSNPLKVDFPGPLKVDFPGFATPPRPPITDRLEKAVVRVTGALSGLNLSTHPRADQLAVKDTIQELRAALREAKGGK